MRAATIVEPVEGRAASFGPFTHDRSSRLLSRDRAELSVPLKVLLVPAPQPALPR